MVETRSSGSKKALRNEPVSSHTRNRGKQATGIVRVPASTAKARSSKSTSRSPPTSQKSPELATDVSPSSSTVNDAPSKIPVKFDNFLQQTLADRRTNGSTAIPSAYHTPPPVVDDPNPKPNGTASDGKGKETIQRKHVTFQGVGPEETKLEPEASTTLPNDGIVRHRRTMSTAAYFACLRERYPKLREVDDFPLLYETGQVRNGIFCEAPLYGLGWTITVKELMKITGTDCRLRALGAYDKIVLAAWKSADYVRDIPSPFMPILLENFNIPNQYSFQDVFIMIGQNTSARLPWISDNGNRERAIHAAMTMLKLGPEKRSQLRWHRTSAKDFYATTPPEVAYPSSSNL